MKTQVEDRCVENSLQLVLHELLFKLLLLCLTYLLVFSSCDVLKYLKPDITKPKLQILKLCSQFMFGIIK